MRAKFFLLGALSTLIAAGSAAADRSEAEARAATAAAALAAKDWVAAEVGFRRALEADESHLPSRLGLAEALFGAGRVEKGVVELRRFLVGADAAPQAVSEAERTRARERLARLDETEVLLGRVVDRHVDQLVALAAKWGESDPGLAADALRRALALRPDHERAKADLAALGRPLEGPFRPIFNGRDTAGWAMMGPPNWTIAGGEVVGMLERAKGNTTTYTKATYGGDFDIRVEARLMERLGPEVLFGIVTGRSDEYKLSIFGVWKQDLEWVERRSQADYESRLEVPISSLETPLDPAAWNSYEVRFRGDRILVLVNDRQVGEIERPADRSPAPVGLVVQEARVAFRKVGIRRR